LLQLLRLLLLLLLLNRRRRLLLRLLPLRLCMPLLSWLLLLLLYACCHLLLGLLPICRCLLFNLGFVSCHVILEDLHHVRLNTKRPYMHLSQQVGYGMCEVQLHLSPAVNLLLQADLACSEGTAIVAAAAREKVSDKQWHETQWCW
jgi:hypothetical protein